jgi:hypothetical protein
MVNQYDKIWRLVVVEYRETKLLFTFDGVLFSFRGNKFSGDLPLKKVKVYHLAFVATAVLKIATAVCYRITFQHVGDFSRSVAKKISRRL